MKSTLFPEKPLMIFPSLAATLGLEESVLFSGLSDRVHFLEGKFSGKFAWYELSRTELNEIFPFWDVRDMQRVCTNLREKGVIIVASAPLTQAEVFKFAFNEQVERQVTSSTHNTQNRVQNTTPQSTIQPNSPPPQDNPRHAALHGGNTGNALTPSAGRSWPNQSNSSSVHSPFLSKNTIGNNWRPDSATLSQLAQHRIPEQFCFDHVPEFITYWRERGEAHHSWGSKFMNHIMRKWRQFEADQHERESETTMSSQWRPSQDAMEILTQQTGVSAEFIEDSIPEFILYWRERGDRHRTWNSKFIQHIRIQWAKYSAAIEHNSQPSLMQMSWRPSADVYDVLKLANIDTRFAESLLPEFVLYWRDSQRVQTSWNTKFLQHVKKQWAHRHSLSIPQTQGANASHTDSNTNRATRDISLEEQLNDRSWAN